MPSDWYSQALEAEVKDFECCARKEMDSLSWSIDNLPTAPLRSVWFDMLEAWQKQLQCPHQFGYPTNSGVIICNHCEMPILDPTEKIRGQVKELAL